MNCESMSYTEGLSNSFFQVSTSLASLFWMVFILKLFVVCLGLCESSELLRKLSLFSVSTSLVRYWRELLSSYAADVPLMS